MLLTGRGSLEVAHVAVSVYCYWISKQRAVRIQYITILREY